MGGSRVLGLFVCLLASGFPGSVSATCYPEHQSAAEKIAGQLEDWSDTYSAFAGYGMCDEGAVAEGFSDSVAKLLTDQWGGVGTLNRLARAHPKFREFVLKHIDSSMTGDQAHTIVRNARFHCPVEAEALCAQIARHARDAAPG